MRRKAFTTALIIFIGICGLAGKSFLTSSPVTLTPNTHLFNDHLVDSAVALLRSGYVVLRSGYGAESYMLAQMNRKNKTYSHCGIVIVESGYPFVYHSIGGEDNPDERLRRDSAKIFFSPLHNKGLAAVSYHFSPGEQERLTQVVHDFYTKRPRFDTKFDLGTDDRLYCSEFVYKAFNRAMDDTGYIKTTSFLGHTFVGTDDLFMNEHARMMCQIQFK